MHHISGGSLFQALGPDSRSPNLVIGIRLASISLPIADDVADIRIDCLKPVFSGMYSSEYQIDELRHFVSCF